jgi:hypothetical protein
MRALFLTACVSVSALAHAKPIEGTIVTKMRQTPVSTQTEAALRLEDATTRAQSTVMALVDRVQHFGNFRSPGYIAPFSGNAVRGPVYGASFSVDF